MARGGRLWCSMLLVAVPVLVAGCGLIGASQITVTARNDNEQEMVVQVIGGLGGEAAPHGDPHAVRPGIEEQLTLDVPGGDWTVAVNGARLVSISDAGSRRGALPVMLILPDPVDFAGGPYWEAPSDWAGAAP